MIANQTTAETIIEIACTLFIIWYAWKWPDPNVRPVNTASDQGKSGGNA